MSPLTPTDPPRLTGYGAARVQRPDGSLVLFLADDVRLVEHRDGRYEVEADDLDQPLPVDRADVVAAAAQVATLVAARLHDARRAHRILNDAIHGDNPDAFTRLADQQLDGRGDE